MKHPANVAMHWALKYCRYESSQRVTFSNTPKCLARWVLHDVPWRNCYRQKGNYVFTCVCLSVRMSVRPSVRPSVCLSVCLSVRPLRPSVWLSVKRITQKLLIKSLWNFTEWLDPVQGPIEYSLNDVDPRSRSLEVKGQNHFSVSKYVESRQKLMCCLFNSLNISKYEYGP